MAQGRQLSAKVTRPVTGQAIERRRLFARMAEAQPGQMIWVSAPAGSGKTLLAASYSAHLDHPCLWLQLDEGDADLASLFHYLGLAALRAAPRYRKPFPPLTPDYLGGLQIYARRFFEEVCRRLKAPALLVLDAYERLPEGTAAHALLREVFEQLPAGVTPLVLSREPPPATYAKLQAAKRLHRLGWDDLCLDQEESTAIAASVRRGDPRARADGEAIHTMAQGWAAGVALLADREHPADRDLRPDTARAPELIFDYFADEVLASVPQDVQAFLLSTALLGEFSARLAGQLTGHAQPRTVLDWLVSHNIFTFRHAAAESRYSYHALFRAFLLQRGRASAGGRRWDELYAQAAHLLSSHGQIEQAAELYQEAAQWDGLAALALREAPGLLLQGRYRVLAQWLQALPGAMVSAQPWLEFWLGSATIPTDLQQARACFERAFQRFEEQGSGIGLCLAWSGVVESHFLEFNDFSALDPWLEQMTPERLNQALEADEHTSGRVIGAMVSAIAYRQPHHREREKWVALATQLAESAQDIALRLQMGATLAQYFSWAGARGDFLPLFDRLRAIGAKQTPPFFRIEWLFVEAVQDAYTGDVERASELLEDALTLALTHGLVQRVPLLMIFRAQLKLYQSDSAAALQDLNSLAEGGLPSAHLLEGLYAYAVSKVAYNRGDHELAVREGNRGTVHAHKSGAPIPEALGELGVAQSLIALGRHSEAAGVLRRLTRVQRRTNAWVLEVALMHARAELALERGRLPLARLLLGKAFAAQQRSQLGLLERWNPERLERLCRFALEQGIAEDVVQQTIRRHRILPAEPELAPPNWPWTLDIVTLNGPPTMCRDGQELVFEGKAPRKPLEMLYTLIALGGRDVSEVPLATALWPDSDGAHAYRAFITTLQRLRKLVGEDVLEFKAGRLSLLSSHCRVDYQLALIDLKQVHEALDRDELDQATAHMRRLLGRYHRPLLDGSDTPTVLAARHGFHTRWLNTVAGLATRLCMEARHEQALHLFERAQAVDALAEVLHQGIIRCCLALGRHSEALVAWRHCRAILDSALGVVPNAETRALLNGLPLD